MQTNIKKWQIALRRYLFENTPCFEYATTFGVSSNVFKKWIEAWFSDKMSWDNFSKEWELTHLIKAKWLNLNIDEHLKIYWHFSNIVPKKINVENDYQKTELITYFQSLCETINSKQIRKTLEWLRYNNAQKGIECYNALQIIKELKFEILNQENLDSVYLQQLNKGRSLNDILKEISLLKRYNE